MKEKILATALSATLLFAGTLRAANAETSVKYELRSSGSDSSMATKRAGPPFQE